MASPDSETPIPDRSTLMRMATGYLARYSASSRRVRQVLARRVQRRCRAKGVEAPSEATLAPALDGVLAELERLGLLNDAEFAAGRTRALVRKGLPERRIRAVLQDQGLTHATDGEPLDDAHQARRFVQRKRIGPYRARDRVAFREKDLRSLLRAGFTFGVAAEAVDSEAEDPLFPTRD